MADNIEEWKLCGENTLEEPLDTSTISEQKGVTPIAQTQEKQTQTSGPNTPYIQQELSASRMGLPKPNKSKKSKDTMCFQCGQHGHWRAQCPQNPARRHGFRRPPPPFRCPSYYDG